MPLISCDEAFDTRVLAARLAAQPKRLAKLLEKLDLMENAQRDLRRADEAGRRVTAILRETGQELLTGWAGQVAEAVTAEARAAAPVVGHVKKSLLVYDVWPDNGRGGVPSRPEDKAVGSPLFGGCRHPVPGLFSAAGTSDSRFWRGRPVWPGGAEDEGTLRH